MEEAIKTPSDRRMWHIEANFPRSPIPQPARHDHRLYTWNRSDMNTEHIPEGENTTHKKAEREFLL